MNIGGEVLNGGRGGGSGGGYSSSSGGSGMGNSFNANNFGRSNFGGSRFDGNSIGSGSDIVRPTFRGVSNYNSAPSISPSRFGGDRLPESGSGYGSPNLGGNSNFGGGYDGGPVKSARMSGWEHLLNGFLGSSFGGGGSTGNSYSSSATASRPEFFNSRAPNEYETPRSTKGSDIQSLLSALQRSGASKSEPERGGESTNFLSQLLGGK
uniref:Glycine-rich cell wall structural protein 1 n=1 Tax=Rhabditophanes sp. KR3021 TaxID=114890 RepID=A0AC35UDQ7_9BILA